MQVENVLQDIQQAAWGFAGQKMRSSADVKVRRPIHKIGYSILLGISHGQLKNIILSPYPQSVLNSTRKGPRAELTRERFAGNRITGCPEKGSPLQT